MIEFKQPTPDFFALNPIGQYIKGELFIHNHKPYVNGAFHMVGFIKTAACDRNVVTVGPFPATNAEAVAQD